MTVPPKSARKDCTSLPSTCAIESPLAASVPPGRPTLRAGGHADNGFGQTRGAVDLVAAAAGALGPEEGGVGAVEDLGHRRARLDQGDHADAGADLDVLGVADAEGMAEGTQHLA